MSATKVFSDDTIALLNARGDNATLVNGYRSVLNTSYMSVGSSDSEATVMIPDTIESVETLEFLEFRPEVAQRIYDDYQRSCNNNPERADIFYSARDSVNSIQGDAFNENDDWAGIIDRIGMSTDFKRRIMDPDPNFTRMRLTGNAKGWIIEAMTMRMEFLKSFNSLVKNRLRR